MLAALEPRRRARVTDLLAEVGHNVSEWHNYANGRMRVSASVPKTVRSIARKDS